ncbi:MAG: hypothetical protein AB7P56_07035 [Nitrososphaeraceae archaeon]
MLLYDNNDVVVSIWQDSLKWKRFDQIYFDNTPVIVQNKNQLQSLYLRKKIREFYT